MTESYMEFVKRAVDEWRCRDGGYTNAAVDVLSAAAYYCKHVDRPGVSPIKYDFFNESYENQEALRLLEDWFYKE